MFRKKLTKKPDLHSNTIMWRNHEILRIEAFSDAVIAFAVTLTIVSLEVPETIKELFTTMRGMIGFAICFLMLIQIWWIQYRYFRYFGLHDLRTIIYNAILLFTILFYVYPLKFLFNALVTGWTYEKDGKEFYRLSDVGDLRWLMIIYGAGYIAVYLIFFLMFLHAKNQKVQLKLSAIELFHLDSELYKHLVLMGIGVASIISAFVLNNYYVGLSGMLYALIGPALSVMFSKRATVRKKKFTEEELLHHAQRVMRSKNRQESEFKD